MQRVCFLLNDDPKVAHGWLPHNGSTWMVLTRSFGDFYLKDGFD
jgi:hypothetical protein